MATYNVKVVVEFEYEVEADDAAAAEQEGWNWEDYKFQGQVESIEVEEVETYCDECDTEHLSTDECEPADTDEE
jgi:hypothetical protein